MTAPLVHPADPRMRLADALATEAIAAFREFRRTGDQRWYEASDELWACVDAVWQGATS